MCETRPIGRHGELTQIAYVVDDVARAVAQAREVLGMDRHVVLPEVALDDVWFPGSLVDTAITLALGYSGDVQIELIQPLGGPDVYTEFLAAGGRGPHHVAVTVADPDHHDGTVAAFVGAGGAAVWAGAIGATRFTYLEGLAVPGTYLEVFTPDQATRDFYEAIRAGAVGG